jgi:hypothetical protein
MEGDFMELKDFIGKIVISTHSKKRYVLDEITAPEITVHTEEHNQYGGYSYYCWETINGDPISNGNLVFEDQSLTEPFKAAYKAYCSTEDARWENYGYYLMKE